MEQNKHKLIPSLDYVGYFQPLEIGYAAFTLVIFFPIVVEIIRNFLTSAVLEHRMQWPMQIYR